MLMLANGPLVTQPPPLPWEKVTFGPRITSVGFEMGAPSPEREDGEPSKRGLVVREGAERAQFQ